MYDIIIEEWFLEGDSFEGGRSEFKMVDRSSSGQNSQKIEDMGAYA